MCYSSNMMFYGGPSSTPPSGTHYQYALVRCLVYDGDIQLRHVIHRVWSRSDLNDGCVNICIYDHLTYQCAVDENVRSLCILGQLDCLNFSFQGVLYSDQLTNCLRSSVISVRFHRLLTVKQVPFYRWVWILECFVKICRGSAHVFELLPLVCLRVLVHVQ